jgi:hypothetical protein
MLMMPAATHTIIVITGEPNCEAIVAGFIKMLLPITLPITIEVADHKPIFREREEVVVDIIVKEDKERNEVRGLKSEI